MSIDQNIAALEREAQEAREKGQHKDAAAAHSKALLLAQQIDQPRLVAVLFNRLGDSLETAGRMQEAVIAYESGLKALAGEKGLEIEPVLRSLGTIPKGYGTEFPSEVPDLYRAVTARDLSAAQSDPALPVRLLINIGNAYLSQPQEAPALNAYEQALRRPEISRMPELKAHVLTHIGLIHRRRREIDAAESLLREAIDLLEKSGQSAEKRRALAILAGIYRDRGQASLAQQTYRQALDLYKCVNDPRGEARTQAGLGHLLLEKERYTEALLAFEQSLRLAQESGDSEVLWHAYWGFGQCRRQSGELELASQLFRQSLDLIGSRQRDLRTDEGKVAFMESVQDIFDGLVEIHLKMAQSDPAQYETALLVAEEARARALYDLMGNRRRRRLPSTNEIRPSRLRPFSERTLDSPVQMALGTPVAPSLDSPSQTAPGIPSISPILPAEPERRSSETSRSPFNPLPEFVDSTAVTEENLGPATPPVKPPPLARLVFHVLSDRTAVFAIPPNGTVCGHVAPWGRVEIARRVRAVRRALEVDESPRSLRAIAWGGDEDSISRGGDYRVLLSEIYVELIAPVADALPLDGTPVVIEPHGALWLLPFSALLDAKGNWLGDRWPLLYVPSTQALEEIRSEPDYGSPKDLKALIVGDPTMPALEKRIDVSLKLKPLPGALEEAKTIAAMFPPERCKVLTGAQADRRTVEKLASEHGILHLATHGLAYAESPLASFVALADSKDADGLLTARQVMSFTLPADLVVLSACQTGLGKVAGEGVIGLSRAFLIAGARSILVSLWSVSDRATTVLMKSFYSWYIDKDDKALALQKAMQELRNRPGYEHPRYWAPFIVVGAEA